MKPYHQANGITIYHGDCREILPSVEQLPELILTDPPYGINYSPHAGRKGGFEGKCIVRGDDRPFEPAFLLDMHLPTILFGANHYADKLPASPSWIVWDKREGKAPPNSHADCELIWTNLGGPARMFRHLWFGFWRASEQGIRRVHPTQKPIVLMEWLIERSGLPSLIDPFMGSGTTLVGARNLGRKAIGIELEEKYCEIAAKRLENPRLKAAA